MSEPLRHGLAPIVGADARVLVLGSFPSARSLETGEYYANRRNQFWSLLGAMFGFDAAIPYAERVDAVIDHGVALWDVVHSCMREGSMDNKIDRKSVTVNDFGAFLTEHRNVSRVFVNGLTAFELLERHADIGLPAVRLPSSSGAMTMSFADKLTQWSVVGE